ncbi:MAG TPA: DNA replication/repair protein RecF [Nocardioidaceae bacterium]|nr:DNA replication/repair protein RecF [Nocardioidaceae bacterium]
MHVTHLSLLDFRSYTGAEVPLEPGVTAFVGPNGQGKTNLVEAIDYVATLRSHRVAGDQPLVRLGAERAIVRVGAVRDDRRALAEVEITPGKANRARLNKSPLPRTRELLGLVRTVLFSPDDQALVKGDPAERRRFLDDLLVARAPRYAGVRQDYDRVLRQRNSLLKSAGAARRSGGGAGQLATLEAWDEHLARTGSELLAGRLALVEALRPHVAKAYAEVAQGVADEPAPDAAHGGGQSLGGQRHTAARTEAALAYKPSFALPAELPADGSSREALAAALLAEVAARRGDELDRGVSLVGPHRDDLVLSIGPLPAKGYASQGESWSFALALRLASFDLLRADGDDPVLILDDVFSELDASRRSRLARLVAGAEQVLVTAAVPEDVPEVLSGARYDVADGEVRRVR